MKSGKAFRRVASGRCGRPETPHAAFTLMELLVVMGILSLLMAILLPALEAAKQQARAACCTGNMRQIGIAANIYSQDYSMFIPRGAQDSNGIWFQLFMPYLAQKPIEGNYRSVTIYHCPAYPNRKQTVCYVVNAWDFLGERDTTGYETAEPIKLSTCRRKAETIYLADNENGWWRQIISSADGEGLDRCDVWNATHLPDSNFEDLMFGRRVARNRHGRGANCLYADWHVGHVAAQDMTPDMWRFHTRR